MRTELYWIPGVWPGRVSVAPRPRGGDWLGDEVRAWRAAGIDVVVSLLEPDEAADLDLSAEADAVRATDIEFVAFPIPDRGVPASREAATELATELAGAVCAGRNVAIHCRQGIGRAALVAVAVLVRLGASVEEAVERVGAARGRPVPETPEQRLWLDAFARGDFSTLLA